MEEVGRAVCSQSERAAEYEEPFRTPERTNYVATSTDLRMATPEMYRAYARHCEDGANEAETEQERRLWLKLAERWKEIGETSDFPPLAPPGVLSASANSII